MPKRDLGTLTGREHDLLVIGGGIHGAAAAWDAAQRGLAVALVEAGDFGSGTSWNSLKTIHGGLRHLQRFAPGLTRESMRERRALLTIAPAIVRPLPFLVPTLGHGLQGREAFALGLLANDVLTCDRNRGVPADRRLPRSRLLSRREVLELAPGLDAAAVTGGALWTDAQVTHSERLLMGFLHAAGTAGAALANHAEAVSLLRDGVRVVGARVRDHAAGAELDVRARLVLNAAGPDGAAILRLAGLERPAQPIVQAMNLVLRRPLLKGHALGVRSGGRHLFLVPWRDRSMVGTAYAPEGRELRAREFLAEAAAAFPWAGLDALDVTLVHQGRVPGRGPNALLDRASIVDHEAAHGVAGLVSALGVKYTTARAVAETAVDIAVARIGRRVEPCRTAHTDLAAARPLTGTLEEQARHAVREEMALHLADAALRRLDLGSAGPPEPTALAVVAATMAYELGWNGDRVAQETRAVRDAYRFTPPPR